MKKIALFPLVICITLSAFAQNKPIEIERYRYPSLEFNDKPAYFDSLSNSVIDLERSQYNVINKATGLGTAAGGFFINGVQSPAHFKRAERLTFIVKLTPGTDPQAILDLVALEVKKDMRALFVSKANGWTGSSSTGYDKIPYEVKSVGNGVYLLTVTNLKPGQYFWGSKDFMFAFGIN